MDLTTATPVEIDTILAEIYGRAQRQEDVYDRLTMHEKQMREGAQKAAEGNPRYTGWTFEQADELKAQADEAFELLQKILAETEPYQAEYQRRGGWSRFFQVPDGHVHSTVLCSTCNKMGKATRFGWLPQWSGRSEAEALEALVTESAKTILCTVCYPSAPVEWTKPRQDPSLCPGSGTRDYDESTARLGYAYGNNAECSHCLERIAVTSTGKLRKHKRA